MTSERSAAAAANFSRVCAPPPPLTNQPKGATVTWSAPPIARSRRSNVSRDARPVRARALRAQSRRGSGIDDVQPPICEYGQQVGDRRPSAKGRPASRRKRCACFGGGLFHSRSSLPSGADEIVHISRRIPSARRCHRSASASTRWSSVREVIPNLANTLWRWYSTVRGLTKSRAPISGFERPSRAKRAIWVSCEVS